MQFVFWVEYHSSVYLPWPGGTYLGRGVPTLARRVPILGVPTLAGRYLPWLGGYLPWLGGTYPGWGVPTLAREDMYLGWGVPTLARGDIYLGCGTPPPPPQVWTYKKIDTIIFPNPTDAGSKNALNTVVYQRRLFVWHLLCTIWLLIEV